MTMRNFVGLIGDQRGAYLLVMLCAALVTGSEAVLHPLLMKAIFDAVSVRESFAHFVWLGLGYLALGVGINILNYGVSLWKLRVDNRIVARVSDRLLSAYFSRDYGTLMREGSGYYVARIRSDVRDGLVPMLATVRAIAVSATTFVLLIAVLLYLSWQAFAILMVIIPVSTAVSLLVSRRIRRLTEVERDSEAAVVDILTRAVGAFKVVRGFGLVPRTLGSFAGSLGSALDSAYRKSRLVWLLQRGSDLTMVVSDVCSIFVGAYLVFRDQLTLGSFIAFMNAFWRAATTVIEIFSKLAEIHGYGATIDRLAAFLAVPPAPRRHATGAEVRAAGIGFSYDARPVLSGFAMAVAPGERALIIGRNGVGKTTLANILCGYLAPSTGALTLPARVSGITLPLSFPPMPVRDLPIDRDLRALFGLDTAEILDAAPDRLSAGQQQKVALGLALSLDADLYVLDEPLANLDTASCDLAMREICRRTAGRILVMIMHNADDHLPLFDHVHVLGETPPGRVARLA